MSIANINNSKEKMRAEIGGRIKQVRERLGLSQKQLSEELDTTQANLANVERGKIYPNFLFLVYLNIKYSVDLNWLISGSERAEVKKYAGLDDRYRGLIELLSQNPAIEDIILAKIREIKLFMGDKI